MLLSPCLTGLQAMAKKVIDILKLHGKVLVLPDSILLLLTEGYTFCTYLLTVPRQALLFGQCCTYEEIDTSVRVHMLWSLQFCEWK